MEKDTIDPKLLLKEETKEIYRPNIWSLKTKNQTTKFYWTSPKNTMKQCIQTSNSPLKKEKPLKMKRIW